MAESPLTSSSRDDQAPIMQLLETSGSNRPGTTNSAPAAGPTTEVLTGSDGQPRVTLEVPVDLSQAEAGESTIALEILVAAVPQRTLLATSRPRSYLLDSSAVVLSWIPSCSQRPSLAYTGYAPQLSMTPEPSLSFDSRPADSDQAADGEAPTPTRPILPSRAEYFYNPFLKPTHDGMRLTQAENQSLRYVAWKGARPPNTVYLRPLLREILADSDKAKEGVDGAPVDANASTSFSALGCAQIMKAARGEEPSSSGHGAAAAVESSKKLTRSRSDTAMPSGISRQKQTTTIISDDESRSSLSTFSDELGEFPSEVTVGDLVLRSVRPLPPKLATTAQDPERSSAPPADPDTTNAAPAETPSMPPTTQADPWGRAPLPRRRLSSDKMEPAGEGFTSAGMVYQLPKKVPKKRPAPPSSEPQLPSGQPDSSMGGRSPMAAEQVKSNQAELAQTSGLAMTLRRLTPIPVPGRVPGLVSRLSHWNLYLLQRGCSMAAYAGCVGFLVVESTLAQQGSYEYVGPTAPTMQQVHTALATVLLQSWQLCAPVNSPTNRSVRPAAERVRRLASLQKALAKAAKERKRNAFAAFLEEINRPGFGNLMSRVFKATKRFAPRTKKTRVQLKDEAGQLLSELATGQAYRDFFRQLYNSPDRAPPPGVLTEGVDVSWSEWMSALSQTAARKAVPQHYAPALLWKECADLLADTIAPQAQFQEGPLFFCDAWVIAYLALLPKPPKLPSHPKALRPISLLDPVSKAFGVILAQRLKPYSNAYLQDLPQFSYLEGRSTSDSLGKAMSHCSVIRQILQSQKANVHTARAGKHRLELAGGLALSVDLSRAFDSIPFWVLKEALLHANVPTGLAELILSFHSQIRFQVPGFDSEAIAGRGIRQGCPLAPQLWAITSGYLIHRIQLRTSSQFVRESFTLYADDTLGSAQTNLSFCWNFVARRHPKLLNRLVEITNIALETHACPECGQEFADITHMHKHLAKAHKISLRGDWHQHLTKDCVALSRGGMPKCFFCHHEFWGWPEFNLHVAYKQCVGLRAHAALHGDNFHVIPPEQSDHLPLIQRPDIRQKLEQGPWYSILRHPSVVQSLEHHCPICHKYVLRAMLIYVIASSLAAVCFLRVSCSRTGRLQRNHRFMTFAPSPLLAAPGSNSLEAPMMSPQDEMKMYCGLLQPEESVQEMELEQFAGSAKRPRSEGKPEEAERTNKQQGLGKGKGNPKGKYQRGSEGQGNRADHRKSELLFLQQVVASLCRLILRHEDALALQALDTRFVLFCSNHDQALPSKLWKLTSQSLARKEGEAAGQHVIEGDYGTLHDRGGDPESGRRNGQVPGGDGSESLDHRGRQLELSAWDSESKSHKVDASKDPIAHSLILKDLRRLEELLPTPNVLHRLHSLRPLTETSEAPVIAFVMDIGLRAAEAQEAYTILKSLSQCAITQVASFNIRPDKLQRSALANHVTPDARVFIQSLLQVRNSTCLLELPDWLRFTRDWQEPHRQHDVAEFAQFLVSALGITNIMLQSQARVQTDQGIDILSTESSAVLRLPLTSASTDVQGLINLWSTRGHVQALNEPLPRLAVVQIARFAESSKDCTPIDYQRIIHIPMFSGPELDTIAVAYCLEAVCLHRGAQATQGHYRALLVAEDSVTRATSSDPVGALPQSLYTCLTDDGVCASPDTLSARTPLLQLEGYVLFYRLQRCRSLVSSFRECQNKARHRPGDYTPVSRLVARPGSTGCALKDIFRHLKRQHPLSALHESMPADWLTARTAAARSPCSWCRLTVSFKTQHVAACPVLQQTITLRILVRHELGLLSGFGQRPLSTGDSASATGGSGRAANKRHEMEDAEDQEKERDAKRARRESKGGFGRGGRGKGNQSGQPSKNNGPRRQPFRRSTESDSKAPDGMMWLLGKLLLRHEDQMGIDRTQNGFVMFFKRESALSLVPLFVQKSQHWNALKEQKQEKMDEIALSLRSFLFHTVMETLVKRIKDTVKNDEQLKTAITLQVFLPKEGDTELRIPFLSYNPDTKSLAPRQDQRPIPEKQCLCPLAIMRFHSTQRLNGPLQGPTVPFLLQVGHRSPEAAELYLSLRSLANSAIWQLVGGSLRPEKMGRSALATELARRLQGSYTQTDCSFNHPSCSELSMLPTIVTPTR
ncbi:Pol [Symbiodinium sp. CCMP2592]|nr:Pol [Symbiodinium sp. CCMP2592]